jgi:hypothetical protein
MPSVAVAAACCCCCLLLLLPAVAAACCCYCLLLLLLWGTEKNSPWQCCTGVRKTLLPHMPQNLFLNEYNELGLC